MNVREKLEKIVTQIIASTAAAFVLAALSKLRAKLGW